MKKLLFVTIFILASLYAYSQDAFIDQLTGTVEIKQPKENSFKAAAKGEKIFQETVISTSFKSFAVVKIGSTTITIRPLTTLSLTEIQKQEKVETINVNLQAGRVRVDVKPPAGTKAATTLTSPSSVASVRGTSFELDTHNLYVNEGSVSFIGNKGQTILVRAGENSRVDQTRLATTPREERNANLMPPNPVGVSVVDISASGVTSQGKNFSLKLVFN
jgi:hypothetical protein